MRLIKCVSTLTNKEITIDHLPPLACYAYVYSVGQRALAHRIQCTKSILISANTQAVGHPPKKSHTTWLDTEMRAHFKEHKVVGKSPLRLVNLGLPQKSALLGSLLPQNFIFRSGAFLTFLKSAKPYLRQTGRLLITFIRYKGMDELKQYFKDCSICSIKDGTPSQRRKLSVQRGDWSLASELRKPEGHSVSIKTFALITDRFTIDFFPKRTRRINNGIVFKTKRTL